MKIFLQCEICKKMYEPKNDDDRIHQKYCSKRCRQRAKRIRLIKRKGYKCFNCCYFNDSYCQVLNAHVSIDEFACTKIRIKKG